MRKQTLLILTCSLFLISPCFSQDSAVASVRYSFTHIMDTTQPENPLKENMILYLGKNMSNYTSWDRIDRLAKAKAAAASGQANGPAGTVTNLTSSGGNVITDIKSIDPNSLKSVSVNNGVTTFTGTNGAVSIMNAPMQASVVNSYYKDQAASKLSFMASAGGKIFSVDEKTPAINWNITQETKEILGLQCQKATCDFRGRSWEAWFCSQLPYNNGPWKLGGLPGLILEASDTKKEVVFTFTSFENIGDTPVAIEIPSTAIKTTAKEFKQYQEAVIRDRQANMGATSGNVVTAITVTGRMMAGPDGKPLKLRVMNNPIEKDTKK